MKTYTQFDAPGRMKIVPTWAAIKSMVLHALPGAMVGAMPIMAVWLRMPPVYLLTFCATALALSYGFYRYQRWEASKIEDWSFIQWGEFVAGAFIGAGVMLLLPFTLRLL